MYDTSIVVVGNALTAPEYRRFERTNALVANFKIASTSRRYDRNSNRWIDGDSLRLRVTCWRRLAEGVVASIRVGDPVVVAGRLYTREWTTEDGQRRTAYELEAVAVGHDLARGVGVFRRGRISVDTTVVEDAETDTHVNGERTEAAVEETSRSHAAVARLAAEGPDSFDGPVIREPVAMADLGTVLGGELGGDLDDVIARASRLGFGVANGAPAGRLSESDQGFDTLPTVSAGGDGDDRFDEAAGVTEVGVTDGGVTEGGVTEGGVTDVGVADAGVAPVTPPEPGRARRGRSRVPVSA